MDVEVRDFDYDNSQDVDCLGSLVFFDDDPTSQTHGEEIHECPGCGERLGLLLLSAQNKERAAGLGTGSCAPAG